MKKSTLLLLLLATAAMTSAQPYKFTRPYGAIQTDINRGYKIIPTQDGNFVVAGEWNGQGYLMKLNCKGDSIERRTYTTFVGGNSVISDVLELPNGDLVAAGSCDHCLPGDTTGKVMLFQTDANLNYKPSVGVKKFTPPVSGPLMTTGESISGTKIVGSGDGFYVLSRLQCLSGPGTFGCWNREDSYVTKLNNNLDIQWHKLLNFENQFVFHYERDAQIHYTPGGLYVSRWGNNLFATVPDSSVVQKTDLSGSPLISRTFRGNIISTALNPAETVLTCVGELDTVAWLMHLDAATLDVLNSTLFNEPNRTQASAVQYSSGGHLLIGTKHWQPFSVQSRIQRMQTDFTALSIDTIPNPDNVTNMSVNAVWPANAEGSRLVSCGIRGFYNRTFFHALSDCQPFNFNAGTVMHVTCNGLSNGSVALSVSDGYGPFQYRRGNGNWQNGNTFNNLTAGTYTFYARDGNGNILSLPVTITQAPVLTATTSVSLNVVTVIAGGGTPPYEYRLGVSGGYQASPVFDSLANGAYILTVRDANGCLVSTTTLVTAPALQASAAVTGQILCFGDATGQITVTASAGIPPYWYSLNNSPLQSNNVFTGLMAGSYSLKVTDSQGNTKTNLVTLTAPPALNVSVSANQSNITVTASGGTGILQYSLDGQNFQASNVFTGLNDGVYTVTVKDANGCVETKDVTVITIPTASFSATPASGCGPLTVQFTNNSSANATSFSWEFPGGIPATSTLQNPTVTYSAAGTYPVTLTASNAAGAGTASQMNFIAVFPLPEASFDLVTDSTIFTFTNTSANATSYLWDFGDGTFSTDTNPVHTFAGSPCSERLIVLTSNNNCGADSDTLLIPHGDPVSPTASFTYDATDLAVTFSNTSQFTESYLWDFGDGTTSTEANPVHTYANPGQYLVQLTVEEYCGILNDIEAQTLVLTVPASEPSRLGHFRLFPNPNAGFFSLEINGKPQEELVFSLLHPDGQLIGRQSFGFQTGALQHTFDFSDLAPGVYMLQVTAQAETKYARLVVAR